MDVTLTATTGRTIGSGPSKRLRAEGKVPGTLYGLGKDPVTLTVEHRDLRQALTTDAALNAIITLSVGDADELCIVKELQRHPVRNDVIHVDFVRVDPDAEILVEVPIVLEGEAKQVLDEQGVVDQVAYTLSVFAKPNAIPNEVTLDVSAMEVGDTLTVADITLPAGARTEIDPEEAIVTATITRAAIEDEDVEGDEVEGEEAAEGDGGDDAAEASADEGADDDS